ncbi:unnamed protein product [Acanthoscelides obtectus]|uniref:Uncharacterized protein n=1 Tax=Acanthoscelides obtectus TaxID=200917 RepID=A0A9P0PYF2_ACAOB|nr:unnamed protein product [Acanthoscelides obtectus]CAK1674683.1 hypothetical protein AOBTE_LOCUS29703 [Acanthoscelides obtectus]
MDESYRSEGFQLNIDLINCLLLGQFLYRNGLNIATDLRIFSAKLHINAVFQINMMHRYKKANYRYNNSIGGSASEAIMLDSLRSEKPDCCWDVNKSPRRKFRD